MTPIGWGSSMITFKVLGGGTGQPAPKAHFCSDQQVAVLTFIAMNWHLLQQCATHYTHYLSPNPPIPSQGTDFLINSITQIWRSERKGVL